MSNPTKDKPTFQCHARRHMSGAVYKTYDAMLAMAKSPIKDEDGTFTPQPPRKPGDPLLVFFGAINPTLANHTDTSPDQLGEHMDKLEKIGWLIPHPDSESQPRGYRGRLLPKRYYILEHFDYPGPCPPYAYAQEDDKAKEIERGEKLGEKGEEPVEFAMHTLTRTQAGRTLLMFKRLFGMLPGDTWDEIVASEKARKRDAP